MRLGRLFTFYYCSGHLQSAKLQYNTPNVVCTPYGQIVQFLPRDAMHKRGLCGGAENVGPENSVPNSRDWKMQDRKVTDQNNKPNFCQYVHCVVSDCLEMK